MIGKVDETLPLFTSIGDQDKATQNGEMWHAVRDLRISVANLKDALGVS